MKRNNPLGGRKQPEVFDGEREVPAKAEDYRIIRWTFQPPLAPGESSDVSFNVVLH